MIVEFLSAAMLFRVCKYLSWRADGLSFITSAASFRDLEAFISPSAAITCNITVRMTNRHYRHGFSHFLYLTQVILDFSFQYLLYMCIAYFKGPIWRIHHGLRSKLWSRSPIYMYPFFALCEQRSQLSCADPKSFVRFFLFSLVDERREGPNSTISGPL